MLRPFSFVVALLVAGGGPLSASDLQFAADGRASVLRLGADSVNRIEAALPGGFVVTVFTGADTKEVRLDRATVRGDRLGGEIGRGRRLPSGNCHHAFFVDLVTLHDASTKSPAERQAIVELTHRVVDKARAVPGLGVDFSGTHSQPADIDRSAVAAEVFGSPEMARTIEAQKKKIDPNNRFRFNPFAKFIG